MLQKQKITSDEELVCEILQGNEQKYGDIIDRYETKLRRYIGRICAFEDETMDEILQLVFIKTYRNLQGFNPSLPFSSWIYRIAHNMTIDHVRKNKHASVSLDFENEDGKALIDILQDDGSVRDEIIAGEQVQALQTIFAQLPDKYRDVLVLHFFEGKSYEEISDILRKPPGTIATWINRAKKQIQASALEPKYIHLFSLGQN